MQDIWIREKKMETTSITLGLYWSYTGLMENKMETTIYSTEKEHQIPGNTCACYSYLPKRYAEWGATRLWFLAWILVINLYSLFEAHIWDQCLSDAISRFDDGCFDITI